jgi:hypothetical protein
MKTRDLYVSTPGWRGAPRTRGFARAFASNFVRAARRQVQTAGGKTVVVTGAGKALERVVFRAPRDIVVRARG